MKKSKLDSLFYDVFFSADIVDEPAKAWGQYCLFWFAIPVATGCYMAFAVLFLLLVDYLFM